MPGYPTNCGCCSPRAVQQPLKSETSQFKDAPHHIRSSNPKNRDASCSGHPPTSPTIQRCSTPPWLQQPRKSRCVVRRPPPQARNSKMLRTSVARATPKIAMLRAAAAHEPHNSKTLHTTVVPATPKIEMLRTAVTPQPHNSEMLHTTVAPATPKSTMLRTTAAPKRAEQG